MNNCFRTATGLLRATPIESLRVEGNFQDFNRILERSSANLASRSIVNSSDGLHTLFWKHLSATSELPTSSIGNIISLLKRLNIRIPGRPLNPPDTQPFIFLDDSLCRFVKNDVNPNIFKSHLAEKIETFSPDIVLFTDGSFQSGRTAYSVVEQKSDFSLQTIHQSRLPDNCGIFIAEIAAIKYAVTYAAGLGQKPLICTDSLSAVKALRRNKNNFNANIITGSDPAVSVQIMWIPSHIGIPGNECADKAAKNAIGLHHVTEVPCFPKVIRNQFRAIELDIIATDWERSATFLREHNPNHRRLNYNTSLTRKQCIILARLRAGKTLFNTQHYYTRTNPSKCTFCDVNLTIPHILTECSHSKLDKPLREILDCANDKMLPKINNSLLKHNISEV